MVEANSTISLSCSSSAFGSNETIEWKKISAKILTYLTENNSHYAFTNNGQQLNIINLTIADQGFYSCRVMRNNTFEIISEYNLIVKSNFSSILLIYLSESILLNLESYFKVLLKSINMFFLFNFVNNKHCLFF